MALSISAGTTTEKTMSKCESGVAKIESGHSNVVDLKRLRQSTQPTVAELADMLSNLKNELSTPSHNGKASDPSLVQDDAAGSDGTSTGNDSGYASVASSPDASEGQANHRGFSDSQYQTAKLRVFEKPIPEDLKNRFFDLKMLYSAPLWKAVSKGNPNPGDISMKLKYMGDNELTAQLQIVVHCERGVSKRVKKFFAQAHVLEDLKPDFHVHVINTGLLRLSASDMVRVYGASGRRSTLCGMHIKVASNEASAAATLGGLIKVLTTKTTFYGITAGHPLAKLTQISSDRPQPLEEDDDDSISDGSDFEDGDSILLLEANGIDLGHDDPSACQVVVGTILDDSLRSASQAGNRDWALIELNYNDWLPNYLPAAMPYGQEAEAPTTPQMLTQETALQDLFCPSEKPIFSSPQSVVIMTCRGFQRGVLATNNSSILMAPGTTFVEALDFLPNAESKLKPGDSGSWAVNEVTGEVYGHVVLVDAFGEAYVVPIQDTLRDIQTHLQAEQVGLPQEGEVLAHHHLNSQGEVVSTRPSNAAGLPRTVTLAATTPDSSEAREVQGHSGTKTGQVMPPRQQVDSPVLFSDVHSSEPSLIISTGRTHDAPERLDPQSLFPKSPPVVQTSNLESGKEHRKLRKAIWKLKHIFGKSGKSGKSNPKKESIQLPAPKAGFTPTTPPLHYSSPFYKPLEMNQNLPRLYELPEYYSRMVPSVYNYQYGVAKRPDGSDSGYATMTSSASPSPNTSPPPLEASPVSALRSDHFNQI